MSLASFVERRNPERRDRLPRISWDRIELQPRALLKDGRERIPVVLDHAPRRARRSVSFSGGPIRLEGNWKDLRNCCSRLYLTLTNTGDESIRLARVSFPIEAGINAFMSYIKPEQVSFFRNGYQSWSTVRSYLPKDKPLRPWWQMISIVSSNLANLPSNIPGLFSSEMYAVISDRKTGESFLVGQGAPFTQFFYITLNLFASSRRQSYFELTFDFGRKMIAPGESIELSTVLIARGSSHTITQRYFRELERNRVGRIPRTTLHGWSSWYHYYTKISPETILGNLDALKHARDEQGTQIDVVQIDDGYQRAVGDWLDLKNAFAGEMRRISDAIREAGFRPGLWIAPFIATRASRLANNHPEYLLRDERGRPLTAGINPAWKGMRYYGLDITNPRFEEHLRRVIRTIAGEWGFTYLKCDFLYGGCLRGGTHNDLTVSRTEVLRRGMEIIRKEVDTAGPEPAFLVGCGMPLPAGIGTVDAMRVGPDTGGFWIESRGKVFRTGSLMGVRNSLRNSIARAPMHRALWLNDPDSVILGKKRSKLTAAQRRSQINAIALTGGILLYSDNMADLDPATYAEIRVLQEITRACSTGRLVAWDQMERELPRILYNTAGYLGVFNLEGRRGRTVTVPFGAMREELPGIARTWNVEWKPATALEEVWSGAHIAVEGSSLTIGPLDRHESRLYRLVR